MGKRDYYTIEKNIEKFLKEGYTSFLDNKTYREVRSKLKNDDYQIYRTFEDSEKVIIYKKQIPDVRLVEITCYEMLTHREIMGSLYATNINPGFFGDIVIFNNHYYVLVLSDGFELLLQDFMMVGRKKVKLKEVPIQILNSYERQYEEITLIVSSTRIDAVIARLIGASRNSVKDKFINNEIFVNYEECKKLEYNLKENDIFSIRKFGKYKFGGVVKKSKSGNNIIKCYKYIDN